MIKYEKNDLFGIVCVCVWIPLVIPMCMCVCVCVFVKRLMDTSLQKMPIFLQKKRIDMVPFLTGNLKKINELYVQSSVQRRGAP